MVVNDKLNLTMLCDFYELTMSQGYFATGNAEKIAYFDVFFRKCPDNGGFAIAAGLEQIIDYIQNLHFTAEDIAKLKVKPNGKRRLVYSYLSTGEAEDYRYYWKSEYKKNPPDWLEEANENWEGNYKVEYWHPEWKAILYQGKDSYLNKLLACGYDGAFLDVIDSFYYFEAKED